MKYLFSLLTFYLLSFSAHAADNQLTSNFVNEVKRALEGNGQISENIFIQCPAPSASGTFIISKAHYEIGKSLGVYSFKDGQALNSSLDLITPKTKDDDFDSDVVVGYDFNFAMPNGQFFLTIMKSGQVTAGANVNGKPGITEVTCRAVTPD